LKLEESPKILRGLVSKNIADRRRGALREPARENPDHSGQ
jgi:hypothetical protein